jgi:hypothetical protein
MAETITFKERAHILIECLPDGADWRDLGAEVAVVQDIEEALADSAAGLLTGNEEVRRQYDEDGQ